MAGVAQATPKYNPFTYTYETLGEGEVEIEQYADLVPQKSVDFLSDNKFPVEQLMIVGTDLKRVERITGRLTYARVALGGLLSGLWLGLFVGLIFSFFVNENILAMIASTVLLGAVFGVVWALIGYAATRGRRAFS